MKPNKSQLAEVPPAQSKRKARIQPHTILGVAVSCLAAGAFVAYAATGGNFSFAKLSSTKSPVPMKSSKATGAESKAGAKARLLGQTEDAKKGGFKLTQAGGGGIIRPASNIGPTGFSGFNLSETNLTPKTASDERDAVISPNGEYIAFRSNGIDADSNRRLDETGTSPSGKYHIWVGRLQQIGTKPVLEVHKITGIDAPSLNAYNQYRPTWISTSNELAFVSESSTGTQIYKVALSFGSKISAAAAPIRLTSSNSEKQGVAWSPDGSQIAFSMKSGANYNIYTVSPNGGTVTRVTGNGNDPGGAASGVQDLNPAYSQVQQNVIYFSSNRAVGQGRRIWAVRNNGANATQITDAAKRTSGANSDNDDFPALSEGGANVDGREILAFQSNSLIDGTDQTPDRNIWSMPVDSTSIGRGAPATNKLFYISSFGATNDANDNLVYVIPPVDGVSSAQKFNIESGNINVHNPEGVAFYRGLSTDYVFVSARGTNRVERFDAETGEARPSSYTISATTGQFTPTDPAGTTTPTGVQVPSPAGLAVTTTTVRYPGNGFDSTVRSLLVVSGSDTKTAVYRYNAETGEPIPASGLSGARFTFGEPAITGSDPLGPTNSTAVSEGIAINRSQTRLYVSNFALDRINVYTLVDFTDTSVQPAKAYKVGQWIGEIKTSTLPVVNDPDAADNPAVLDGPTGLAFGPDLNNDDADDLYVASSITNDVFAFNIKYNTPTSNGNGTRIDVPTNGSADAFNYAVRNNNSGNPTNLNSPEGIRIDANGVLYVAVYGGQSINRYEKSGSQYVSKGINGGSNANWIQLSDSINGRNLLTGPSYFDFNPNFAAPYINSGFTRPVPSLIEQAPSFTTPGYDSSASVVTNILSSPSNFADSKLSASGNKVEEDKSADIEASFGHGNSSQTPVQSLVRVVFSSNRIYAPNPESNITGQQSNPYGGTDSSDGIAPYNGTADLWLTLASDVEAPIIEPQVNNYPMLSPVHNPGSFAGNSDIGGRTPNSGLYPGNDVKLALTIRERGSGVSRVSFAFYDAESPSRFAQTYPVSGNGDPSGPPINEGLKGVTQDETYDWQPVSGFDYSDAGMSIDADEPSTGTITDDGPNGVRQERQANAIAGDGIYYAAKSIRTPTKAGDYYIGIRIEDRSSSNQSYYRFVWGFSTRNFQVGTARDLFVSDNTAGQYIYSYSRGGSFVIGRPPVESYYLDNWSTQPISGPYSGSIIENKVITARSNPTTFDNVDTWRVLSRGPIEDDILRNNYYPGTLTQIDPADVTGGFKEKTRIVADAQKAVLWAAPYAGNREVQFDIPGSIKEGATKQQLKGLLNAGGRLFVTGRNVLTALGEGADGNTFRDQELYASPDGKIRIGGATAVDPLSTNNAFPEIDRASVIPYPKRAAYSDLQFPRTVPNLTTNDFRDGSYSHNINSPEYIAKAIEEASMSTDTIKSADGGATATIFESYKAADGSGNGKLVGQNIIKSRGTGSNSIESRVAIFSFNFDAINRRYTKIENKAVALDVRSDVAYGIRTWFKTGGIHGKVTDDAGNPVANVLLAVLEIGGTSNLYAVRSNTLGEYDIQGLPAGKQYNVIPVIPGTRVVGGNVSIDGDTLPTDDVNRQFYKGDRAIAYYIEPGQIYQAADVKVYRSGPGSLIGKIYAYQGEDPTENPLDRTLHGPVDQLQVLLTVAPNQSGQTVEYARLSKTDSEGRFSFADAPSKVKLQLIINPVADDVPNGSDISKSELTANRTPSYARRVVGLGDPGDGKRREGSIIAPPNDSFTVNDTYINQPTNFDIDTYPTPPTDTEVDEGLPLVITRGEPISGKFSMVAGVDTPVVGAGWVVELRDPNAAPTSSPIKSTVTKADGSFTFTEVTLGNYVIVGKVPASVVNGYDGLTATTVSFNTNTIPEAEKSAQNITAKISHIVGAIKVNGEYVSGATVTLQTPSGEAVEFGNPPVARKGTTGRISGDANYFIGYVPNGTYKLFIQLPNGGSTHLIDSFEINSANEPLKILNHNFTISEVKVNVSTAYSGLSKAGATVQILSSGGDVVQSGNTDSNGEVVFRGVPEGQNYTVKATNTLFGVSSTDSKTINVTEGTLPTVNLALKWDSLGGIVRVNGTPKSGAKIRFFLNGTEEVTALAATTAGNGTYQAGKNSGSSIARPLAAGTYTVRASIISNGLTLSKEETVTISSPFTGNIITVPDFNFQESYLTGQVRFNGQPASGFQVKLYEPDGITPYKDADGNQRSAVTDANGTYRLYSVPIGEDNYTIKVLKVIGAYTPTATIDGPTIQDGVTQAPTIEITSPAGLSGQVRVNGEGASGATVQVLTSKKKPLSPPVIITADANGRFFVTNLADGSYNLQATYSENGVTPKPINKSFKLKGGIYKPASITFDFKLTRLKGLVRANGKPVQGAQVILLDKKGKALKQTYAATTDVTGNYLMSGVKSGTYRVQATFAGSSGYREVKVGNLKTTVAPTIDLTTQELEVKTEFRVGNSKIGDAPGATVEILSSTGNSLGSAFVKETDSNSKASFFGLGAGSYRARVTMQSYSTTTSFSVGVGFSEQTLPITLSQVRDLLLLSESNGLRTTELGGIDIIRASLLVKPSQDVKITLNASNPSEATFQNGNSVNLTFTPEEWNVEQQVTVVGQQDNVSDGNATFEIAGSISTGDSLYDLIPDFTLSGTNFEGATIPSEGPTFPANSKNLVSVPFTNVDGNITVAEVFGNSGYTLYRFNSAGQQKRFLGGGNALGTDWIPMGAGANMERGRGYLLVTGNQPVTMLIPANPTVFAGDSFAVDVVRNPNYETETGDSNINNGWDLVGFPFDPTTVSGVDILQQAQVLIDGVLYSSFLEAAGAGKVSNRIYAVDSLGRPVELTPANSSVKSYKGYFVKIFSNKAKIILNANPTAYNGGGGSGSGTSANVKKTSAKKS